MKHTLIALAIITATAAIGADIVIEPTPITIPDAAVADVQAWLDAQPDLYTTTTVDEQRIDPEDGHVYTVAVTTRVLVPETPKQKLLRIIDAQTKAYLRAGVRQVREAREQAKAAATVEAAPDPIDDGE